MKKMTHVCAALAALVMLAACESLDDIIQKVSVDPAVKVERDSDDKVVPVDLDKYPERSGVTPYYHDQNPTKENRNSLQDEIIKVSQVTCTDFRKRLYALHAARKVLFQGTALLLSGAAAAVGGEAAKTALSAASAGILGVDKTIDAHVLQNAAITAILNTIRNERSELLTGMRKKQERVIEVYSMQAAVTDAIRYNKLCSLTEAVSVMGTATQAKNANANIIRQIRVNNARIKLERAEDDLVRLSTVSPEVPKAIKAASARRDRLKEALEALEKATTAEAVKR